MTTTPLLDNVLLRQLKKAGAIDPMVPPSGEPWTKFLGAVNDYYRHMNEDRAMLTRSMELSTEEMNVLRAGIEAQRDQLRAVVHAIGEALGMFGDIVQQDSVRTDVTGGLQLAKRALSERLDSILGAGGAAADSTQISGISAGLVSLADQLVRLVSETAERAQIKKELEVARVVQALLVPAEDVIERPFVRVAGHFQPASECGGDWWGVYDLPDGRVATLVGDVTGHGISSAILTGAAKAACDLAVDLHRERITASELLRMMNTAIHGIGKRQVMMTCVAGIFEAGGRALSIASAGHPFTYHVRGGQLRAVVVNGQPLGAGPDASYESVTIPLAANDAVVWFTDGVVECENDAREQFSEKRLRAICQRAAPLGARAVRDAVVEAIAGFKRHREQIDDITLVVASVR
ncbi:MAG: hypothetical protein NVS3B10_15620 [Polyangiales bacterium]